MIQSIREICAEKGVDINDTVYADSFCGMLDFQIVSGRFYELIEKEDGCQFLRYKNCLDVVDFPMLREAIPKLSQIRFPKRESFPYFTAGLEEIAKKIMQGEPVAVEGGPCLFGTNEVMIEILRKDGCRDYFDYNTGKSYLAGDTEIEEDFSAYVKRHAENIRQLRFENRKKGLTPQEWAFIKYPFEIAAALDAPLAIPIPDMSYRKYLKAVLAELPEDIREQALSQFRQVEYEISDQYLELIQQMQSSYPGVFCQVVHDRDQELCSKFYQGREPFVERNKILRTLTAIPERMEPVKDYVSMPALPYYLWGITNVIEVDSMDEADSFRKCRKAHKGTLTLACVLFPELLSKDRIHTIFDAPEDRKEYGNYVLD